ncbi:MAG TPA: tRNA (adenosine(37)-N6)-threonylcarbamoyltransferase complex transferase subunit TsaD [Micropepsaceae bacterium]|nr:tRNA (adenosine(37)-N6)-threonylcarbamoyltransferase complex transferase subunit TsaD [Micropepsaceae bacterium]
MPSKPLPKSWTVLGLETSCDETAAAVVRGAPPGPGELLSNVMFSQVAEHSPYGGVVPEIAARAHVELLDGIVERALDEAGLTLADMDAVAATAGPGLIGGVMVGLVTAKALALAAGKPLIALNHLEAHALSARLSAGTPFPFLLLLISGGHCQLMAAEAVGRYRLYGATIDDAVGEAFDKTAKLLALPYPGGPQIEVLALGGNAKRFALPRPMLGREGADFSFSGLKTAVRSIALEHAPLSDKDRSDLAAGFQAAVLDVLLDRVHAAMQRFRTEFSNTNAGCNLVAAGGVAANKIIRHGLERLAVREEFSLSIPPPFLCTDNGAMIAWAGLERLSLGLIDGLDVPPLARWPLQNLAKSASSRVAVA